MYVEVKPNGAKYWFLKYRFHGKEKRISLGVYPEVTLKMARDLRVEKKRLLSRGIDPSAERKARKVAGQERAANTFESVTREWFTKNESRWAPAYSSKIIRRFEMYIFPWLGGEPIADIKAPDLLPLVRRIEERGAVETAHRTLALCGQVLRYAIATSRAERDCTTDLRGALAPAKRTHFAATTDPSQFGEILRAIDSYKGNPVVEAALKLAPLLFVRPGELRMAKWADIDLETNEWRYTASKNKPQHIVPLPRQAAAIFSGLQPISGHTSLVFPSIRSPKGTRPISDATLTAALRRMGIDKSETCVHGFRATARTLLEEVLGYRPELTEHQLAHKVKDPLGRAYNRTQHLPERREMMQAWADYLDKLKADT